MSALLDRRLTAVWLALMVITVLSWWMSEINGIQLGALLVVVLAFVKVRFVALEFMDLRLTSKRVRTVTESVLVLLCLVLVLLIW
jgi:hypothetical protein